MMKQEKPSDQSIYLTIGDWKIYVEVSDATQNLPYISAWQKGWPTDCTMTFTKAWCFSDYERAV